MGNNDNSVPWRMRMHTSPNLRDMVMSSLPNRKLGQQVIRSSSNWSILKYSDLALLKSRSTVSNILGPEPENSMPGIPSVIPHMGSPIPCRRAHFSVSIGDGEEDFRKCCQKGQVSIYEPTTKSTNRKMVDFLIGHYTYRIFPPAIDIIPTLLAVVYSNGKYTN